MNIRLIAYSARGCGTAEFAAEKLEALGHSCQCQAPAKYCQNASVRPLAGSAGQWAEEGFREADALIFCCAAGIAVRAIAPFVRKKTTDPAVIVLDECRRFSISLLSGHIGGANELAEVIAAETGAIPVVTTATDLNGLFAVDVFARKNHLKISSMKLAKEVSAALLAGKTVGFRSEFPVSGKMPPELSETAELGIAITNTGKQPFSETLQLIPRRYAAGIGCKRDTDPAVLEEFFVKQLEQAGISAAELRCIASIDVKKDEQCLLALSKKYDLPFFTYSAEQLNELPGEFSGSDFVRKTVGVDCVCERAAVMAGGTLIQHKTAANGMTFALSRIEEDICFE